MRNHFPKVPDQLVGQYLSAFVLAIDSGSGISNMSSVSLHYYRSDIYGLEILLLLKRAATGPPRTTMTSIRYWLYEPRIIRCLSIVGCGATTCKGV
jgi:hypothetical protein